MHTDKTAYARAYRKVDFRKHPELYRIGKGEQGVLMAEPYKSEILPHWRIASPQKAKDSARKIYILFLEYKKQNDFVGMGMARKFLQMGFTRARRYANHSSGRKYLNGIIRPQDKGSEDSEKAKSARIFYGYFRKANDDELYRQARKAHRIKTAPKML